MADGVVLRVSASGDAVCGVAFSWTDGRVSPSDANPLLTEAIRQLRAYFRGELREFTLPLEMQGTSFQKQVWRELLKIPYGETRSYADLATSIGVPKAVRAVGAANGANPIAIVIPCHRVIGSSGKLVGYGGGLELKRELLKLERRQQQLF